MRTLVLGGIRSGKSQWAEAAIAAEVGPHQPVRYLATGIADSSDPTWSRRVGAHAYRRPPHWLTIETPCVTKHLQTSATATLIDDLGGWLAAAMDRHGVWESDDDEPLARDVDDLVETVRGFGPPLVLVSPEVGLSVVPAAWSGRLFADELGLLNQRLAAVCDRIVLVVAGHPMLVKGPAL